MRFTKLILIGAFIAPHLPIWAQLQQMGDVRKDDVIFYDIKLDDPGTFNAVALTICPVDLDISTTNLNIGARAHASAIIGGKLWLTGTYKRAYFDRIEKVYNEYDSEGATYELPEQSFSIYKDRAQSEFEFSAGYHFPLFREVKDRTINVKSIRDTNYVVKVPLTRMGSIGPRFSLGYKSSMYIDPGGNLDGTIVSPADSTQAVFDVNGGNTTMIDMQYVAFGLNFQRSINALVELKYYGDRYLRSVVNAYADVLYAYQYEIDNVFAPIAFVDGNNGFEPVYGEYELMSKSEFKRIGFRFGLESMTYRKRSSFMIRGEYARLPNVGGEDSLRILFGYGLMLWRGA